MVPTTADSHYASATRGQKLLLSGVFVLSALLVSTHFVFTYLFLMPLNPVKVDVRAGVERYMLPWFSQNWNLFAPNPEDASRYVLVSCRLPSANGAEIETPWFDATTPLLEQHYGNRLAPGDRLARVGLGIIHILVPPADAVLDRLRAMSADDPETKEALREDAEERSAAMRQGTALLGRLASVECDRLYGKGAATEVRGRLLSIEVAPFSQRAVPGAVGDRRTVDFDWMPYTAVDGY